MSTYEILVLIFIFEVIFFVLICILLFFFRIFAAVGERKRRKLQQETADQIINALTTSERQVNFSGISKWMILNICENFEKKMAGGDWEQLKRKIVSAYLYTSIKKWKNSFFWKRRFFVSRVLALVPDEAHEQILIDLMHDSRFLVSSKAVLAAVKLEKKTLIEPILELMENTWGYPYFFYRDLLLQTSRTFFMWIEEKATEVTKKKRKLILLDLLGSKQYTLFHLKLDEDLVSADPEIRFMAVRLLALNPQNPSLEALLKSIEDPVDKIRAVSARGLGMFPVEKSINKLEEALKDEKWEVRLAAAKALKKMGSEGSQILERQVDKRASTVSSYALKFA